MQLKHYIKRERLAFLDKNSMRNIYAQFKSRKAHTPEGIHHLDIHEGKRYRDQWAKTWSGKSTRKGPGRVHGISRKLEWNSFKIWLKKISQEQTLLPNGALSLFVNQKRSSQLTLLFDDAMSESKIERRKNVTWCDKIFLPSSFTGEEERNKNKERRDGMLQSYMFVDGRCYTFMVSLPWFSKLLPFDNIFWTENNWELKIIGLVAFGNRRLVSWFI